MKKSYLTIPGLLTAAMLFTACGKKESPEPTQQTTEVSTYSGEKAVKVRKETIIELLAIKKNVKTAVSENREKGTVDSFMTEVKALRPRLEYIKMQSSMLPESERKIIRGELAVATNQLEKDLTEILNKQPGNDDLAMEVVKLRKQLSPIELDKVVQKF